MDPIKGHPGGVDLEVSKSARPRSMGLQEDDDVPILIETSDTGPEDKRVPITLICGFLGAGKSTLLKRILTERHGYRIAVIMNEFGDTADIEAKAIKVPSVGNSDGGLEQASEEFLELANGCLCCSIKDSGVAAIEKLMSRKGAFDHILLETTGLADPGPIAAMFWQNEEFAMGLGKDIFLDGVICVVDAVFAEKQIQEDAESDGIKHSLRQIAAADVLLLNKSDLVAEFDLAGTESLLHQLNPSIPIYKTVRAQVDLSRIMGVGGYSERSLAVFEGHGMCSDHEHEHRHEEHVHAGISNILVHVPSPLKDSQVSALDGWVRSVLWENTVPPDIEVSTIPRGDLTTDMTGLPLDHREPDGTNHSKFHLDILRCKGIWWNGQGEQFVLQGVRNLYEITKVHQAEAELGESRMGKLVFIGKGLNKAVEDSLRRIVVGSAL